MPVIDIAVRDKRAIAPRKSTIICGNSDYEVAFDFDAEWDGYPTKTARFVWNRQYVDVVFEGNVCPIPVLYGAAFVEVGVFAGNLHTTTSAYIGAEKSVLCDGGSPANPPNDVYAQLMEMIQGMDAVDYDDIVAAITEYMKQNPFVESDPTVPAWAKAETKPEYTAKEVGAVATAELANAITLALAQAKESGEFDGTDGKDGVDGQDGYTPVKGVDYFDGVDGKDGRDGQNGQDGYTPVKGVDYFDGKNGVNGRDGLTPHIGDNGNWWIGDIDTGSPSRGETVVGKDGKDGRDGYTPIKGVDYFDGNDGKDGADGYTPVKGVDYFDGQDGYTPQKNVDYFDGKDGSNGTDGVSCTHSWNGTTLTITSASGTSSANLKGDKGDTGNDGYTPVKGKDYFDGVNGKDGSNGKDGYTPVKGTDYYTSADKAEMVNMVLAALPAWTGGSY